MHMQYLHKIKAILRSSLKGVCCLLLAAGGVFLSPLHAETRIDRAASRNELRIGWGDQIFETLVFHQPTSFVTTGTPGQLFDYKENYHYLQHYFVEYQYRFNSWFGIGALLDGSGVTWDGTIRNGLGEEVERNPGQFFVNIVAMPTFRFTYLHRNHVDLFSSFGLGACINSGTELDIYGHRTVAAPAFNATLLAVSVNFNRFFITADFGGMYSLLDINTIFMLKSRMFAASLGVRF